MERQGREIQPVSVKVEHKVLLQDYAETKEIPDKAISHLDDIRDRDILENYVD